LVQSVTTWLAGLSPGRVLLLTVALAVAIELVTCVMRFGIGMQSTRDTGIIGYLTFNIRIHHGYVGLVMLLIACLRADPLFLRNALVILGGSLVISDGVHHFLVLWPVTGSPEFDLVYPAWHDKTGGPRGG
jgi:hypothetical protein